MFFPFERFPQTILPDFSFRDCKLSLLKPKLASKISFSVYFHLILFLSSIICIISSKVLRNHNINYGTLKNAHLQICSLLLPFIFPRNLVHTFRRDWCTCAWKKNFIAFMLLNQWYTFYRKKVSLICIQMVFFEFNSWGLNSVEYWIFFIVECLNLRRKLNFNLIYKNSLNYLTEN